MNICTGSSIMYTLQGKVSELCVAEVCLNFSSPIYFYVSLRLFGLNFVIGGVFVRISRRIEST